MRDSSRHLRFEKLKNHDYIYKNSRAAVGCCKLRKKQEMTNEKNYHTKTICSVESDKKAPSAPIAHKMKRVEKYYVILKQAKKCCGSGMILGNQIKVSLPESFSKETKTDSKSAISIQTCKTAVKPEISIISCKTPVQPNKTTLMPIKNCEDIPAHFFQSPPSTPTHTLVAPKWQPHHIFSIMVKNNVPDI